MYSPKKSTPYSEDGRGYLYPYICYMIPEMTLSTWNIPRILWLFGHFQGLECTIYLLQANQASHLSPEVTSVPRLCASRSGTFGRGPHVSEG